MPIMVRFSKEQGLVVAAAAKFKGLSPMAYTRSAAFLYAKEELRALAKNMGDEKLVKRAIDHIRETQDSEVEVS